ncbi:MAG TPA: DNA primase [Spirochaetota bacterium]|nr:DNA primase [Spirochaetota bacterium]
MSIPKETIDIVRDRAPIQEIVKKYVPTLQKKGRSYVGLCPFHKEKTPSFTVSTEKQIFYCFGCQTGGNVFTFISKIERLNFPESVVFLGNMLGITVKDEKIKEQNDELDGLKKVNLAAMSFYKNMINSPRGATAKTYLLNRGVSERSISEFHLGFAPDDWGALTGYFRKTGINQVVASKLGLLSSSNKDGSIHYYDRFRGRIVFPIFNRYNEVVAFGGRIIDAGEPKYLNSPESELFQKRNILYGLNIARQHIASLGRAIVVEGYLDVIGCHQAGIQNVVAPLGTALTDIQVRVLARFCSEIVLLFDADSAGINASLRSLDVLKDISVDAKVAALPEDDPFDFIKNRGVREFMAIVDSSSKPVDFRIERTLTDPGNRSRIEVLRNLFAIVGEIEYESEQSHYLKKISTLLKIGENEIRSDFKRYIGKNDSRFRSVQAEKATTKTRKKASYLVRAHKEMVELLCRHPELVEKAIIDFSETEMEDPDAAAVFSKMGELFSAGEKISVDSLFDYFPDGSEKIFLENCLAREYRIENPAAAYTEIYINIRMYMLERKIEHYKDKIRKAQAGESADTNVNLTEIEVEIEILTREWEKLSSYKYNIQTI